MRSSRCRRGKTPPAAEAPLRKIAPRPGAPSFTVEVRRRPRLAATSRPNEQSLETKPLPAAFDRELHLAEAAAIGAKKADQSCVDPKGRILPSLVADEPLDRLHRDASLSATESQTTSRAPKRPWVRRIKGRAHTLKPPPSSESSPAESTPLADELSAPSRQPTSARSDEGIGVPPGDPTTELSKVIGSSGGPALRTKTKQRDKMPTSRDHGRATSVLIQRSTTGTNPPATTPSSVDERSPQSRKRTIMARYVFDDELKPGARWKRRLLRTR